MADPIRVYFDGGPKDGKVEIIRVPETFGLLYDGPRIYAYYRATTETVDTPDGPADVLRYQGRTIADAPRP